MMFRDGTKGIGRSVEPQRACLGGEWVLLERTRRNHGTLKNRLDASHMESLVGMQQDFRSMSPLLHRPDYAAFRERTVPRPNEDQDDMEQAAYLESRSDQDRRTSSNFHLLDV